jgi:hypothetical protein
MAAKKAKSAKTVKTPRNKLKHPSWEGWEDWNGFEYGRKIDSSREFYYTNFKLSDLLPNVWAWMKEQGYTAKQIKQARAATGSDAVSPTLAVFVTLLYKGMPDYNETYAEYWESLPGTMGTVRPFSERIREKLEDVITAGEHKVEEEKAEEKAKDKTYTPTIQDRLHDQSLQMCEEIDAWLDTFDTDRAGFDAKAFDFKKHFELMKTTQAHARKIIKFYQSELDEWRAVSNPPSSAQIKKMSEQEADEWEQVKEGYGHIKKAEFKKIVAALESLIEACEFVIESSKATRKTRKPKSKPAAKIVEKVKYKKTDDKYKLASIDPANIIGATTLWTFNTKTRKLGRYVASEVDPTGAGRAGSGLSVKGTTITGFDEAQSVQKTLRKPDDALKNFKAAGKVKLRKFMEEIATTETKLNGRLNPDTIILKVT